jgi:hypothetical protein
MITTPAATNGRTASPTTVQVRNLKILRNASALKATCTVKYDGTTVDEVKVFWTDGRDAPFVRPPQLVTEWEGRRTWTNVIRWNRELYAAITAAVLDAYYDATGQRPRDPFGDDDEVES